MDLKSITTLWECRNNISTIDVDQHTRNNSMVLQNINQLLSSISDIIHEDLMITQEKDLFLEKLNLLAEIGPNYYVNLKLAIDKNTNEEKYATGEENHDQIMNERAQQIIKKYNDKK